MCSLPTSQVKSHASFLLSLTCLLPHSLASELSQVWWDMFVKSDSVRWLLRIWEFETPPRPFWQYRLLRPYQGVLGICRLRWVCLTYRETIKDNPRLYNSLGAFLIVMWFHYSSLLTSHTVLHHRLSPIAVTSWTYSIHLPWECQHDFHNFPYPSRDAILYSFVVVGLSLLITS